MQRSRPSRRPVAFECNPYCDFGPGVLTRCAAAWVEHLLLPGLHPTDSDMASLTDLGRKSHESSQKKIPTCCRHLGEDSGPLASGHSLYAMVGRNPRPIDDFNTILAHSGCRGPTREVQGRPRTDQGRTNLVPWIWYPGFWTNPVP